MATTPTTPPIVLRPIYLVPELGEYALLPNGSIINIGGVVGPNFTVGGKALLFADGSATDGSPGAGLNIDLQNAYQNSIGEALIDFTSGKDLVLQAINDKQFRFDADTGDVTIAGNLIVQGSTTTVINAAVNVDRIKIQQIAGTYIPFIMEPAGAVVPTVNVVDIKIAKNGSSVFTIGPTGTTYIQALTVGLINGIDLVALKTAVDEHLGLTGIKHAGKQIYVDTTGLPNVTGQNVQDAIESISSTLTSLNSGDGGYVRAYEHVQLFPQLTWVITHNKNTRRVQITIWDMTDEVILPDSIRIQDANTVVISYNSSMTGRAILILF